MSGEGLGEAELAEIEEMVRSATPGPWHVRVFDDAEAMNLVAISTVAGEDGQRFPEFDPSGVVAATLVQHPRYVDVADGKWEENARFIAESRRVVPALLAEIRRLRALPGHLGDA